MATSRSNDTVENQLNEDSAGAVPDLETLGRQRPAVFSTTYSEIGFCFSMLASMLMAEYFISGFNLVMPNLALELDIPPESRTWPASVFSLITGALLLPAGRLADMYGGYIVFTSGLVWFFVWSLVAGLSQNYLMLVFCRALQGLGPSAFLPSGIMLLGSIYRPGPRKNLVFGLYGAFAPLGFFFGILMGGVTGEFLSWRWYFWLGAVVVFIVSITSWVTIPNDRAERRDFDVKMDWLGVFTIVPGLILLTYAITSSSNAPRGWATWYIYVTFIFGTILLGAAFYVEGWVSTYPLLPFSLFKPKSMKPLVLSLFFSYGVFGIFLFYSSFYMELILGASILQTAVWFIPMIAGGLFFGALSGYVLHRLPGRVLLIISGVGYIGCTLFFAIMPENPNYWAFVFPAMIGATVGVDITYVVSNVFITTNLPKHQQGVAGALINSLLFIGISFFLGIADIVVSSMLDLGLRKSYQAAFWLGVGCSGLAIVFVFFTRIGNAKSDLTFEEREQQGASLAL